MFQQKHSLFSFCKKIDVLLQKKNALLNQRRTGQAETQKRDTKHERLYGPVCSYSIKRRASILPFPPYQSEENCEIRRYYGNRHQRALIAVVFPDLSLSSTEEKSIVHNFRCFSYKRTISRKYYEKQACLSYVRRSLLFFE